MEKLAFFTDSLSCEKWVPILLAITLLALPLSSTAKSIALGLSVLAILLTPSYRHHLRAILFANWSLSAWLLFFIALLGCLWSEALIKDQIFVIEKYSKLIYLPILAVGFQAAKTRQMALHAFLLAMIITCLLSILKFHGFLQAFHFDPDRVFRNHIMTGFMVAFATYLSCLFAYRAKGRQRVAYGLLALLFSYQVLFVNGGRTGYIIYLLLMGLLILQLCSFKQALLGVVLLTALFNTSYLTSAVMKGRVDGLVKQVQDYQHNQKNTDLGLRLQFHDFAHTLFNRHPLLGNGTASFTYSFAKETPVPAWSWRLWEPHSQYWLVAAEFGCLGLVILFFFFFSLLKESLKLREMKQIALAMFIPFLIGNGSDSLLFYSGSGYFFLLFMALCFGEKIADQKER